MGDFLSTLSEDEEEEPQTVFDKYQVDERIGLGAFGEVRACSVRKDYKLSKWEKSELPEGLAVKIVDQQNPMLKAAEAYTTARDEVEILQSMNHRHVVRLVETFEDPRFLYVVMERIPGGELFKAMSNKKAAVMESDMAKVTSQLMQALAYLHSVGVAHRDVKAQNILLSKAPDASGRLLQSTDIKLIDFGLAAQFKKDCSDQVLGTDNENHFNLVCGTPVMAAPEIWSAQANAPQEWVEMYGGSYGPKVDVWSAGIVVYLALMGNLPFCDKETNRLAQMICDPNNVPSFTPMKSMYKVSNVCVDFLRRILEKDPEERPSAVEAQSLNWLKPTRTSRKVEVPVPSQVTTAASAIADAVVPRATEAYVRQLENSLMQIKAEAEQRRAMVQAGRN